MKLSRAQREVVDHRGSDLQVIACSGSGKTESISRRIAALLSEGALPEAIVAFTFTEKAAAELRDWTVRRVVEMPNLGPEFRRAEYAPKPSASNCSACGWSLAC